MRCPCSCKLLLQAGEELLGSLHIVQVRQLSKAGNCSQAVTALCSTETAEELDVFQFVPFKSIWHWASAAGGDASLLCESVCTDFGSWLRHLLCVQAKPGWSSHLTQSFALKETQVHIACISALNQRCNEGTVITQENALTTGLSRFKRVITLSPLEAVPLSVNY